MTPGKRKVKGRQTAYLCPVGGDGPLLAVEVPQAEEGLAGSEALLDLAAPT